MKRWVLYAFVLMLFTACVGNGHSNKSITVESVNPYVEKFGVLSEQGLYALQQQRWQAASSALQRAHQAAVLSANTMLQVKALYNLAVLHARQGEYQQAQALLTQAQNISFQPKTNDALRIEVLQASLAVKQGTLSKAAMLTLTQAMHAGQVLEADVYLGFANLAYAEKQYKQAIWAYQQVLQQKLQGMNVMHLQARAMLGLAMSEQQQMHTMEALRWAESCLQLCQKIGLPQVAAHSLLLQAKLEYSGLSVQEKEKRLMQARTIYQALHDMQGQQDVDRELKQIRRE